MNRKLPSHRCAADGCDKEIPGEVLMCYPHWREVPAAARRRLTIAWNAFHKDPFDQAKRAAWNEARSAAIAARTESARA